jgi:hypothetical protein
VHFESIWQIALRESLMKNLPMNSWSVLRRGVLFFLAIWTAQFAAGHDLSTSYTFLRIKPETLELEIKFAADSAWAQVQKTIAPGTVFTLEEFETIGRPHLIAFARKMEELTIDGTVVPPREIAVVIVEDNFIFTLTYPRPPKGILRLTETYLAKMPPDYTSRVSLVDEADEPIVSKTLSHANLVFETVLPVRKAKASAPPSGAAAAATPAR